MLTSLEVVLRTVWRMSELIEIAPLLPHFTKSVVYSKQRHTHKKRKKTSSSSVLQIAVIAYNFFTSTYYSVPFPVSYHFSVHLGLGHPSAFLFLLAFWLSR